MSNPIQQQYRIPSELSGAEADLAQQCIQLPVIRDRELQKIRDQFEGGRPALGPKYIEKPPDISDVSWARRRKMLTHVNLVKPVARCWCSALTGGQITRRIVENPHQDIVEQWIKSVDYDETVAQWVENAVLYGTAVALPQYDKETEELSCWLPDPVSTYLVFDKFNRRKLIAVAEITQNRIEVVALWGQLIMTRDGDYQFCRWQHDQLPCRIAYGVNRSHRGEPYGLPLVGDAADWSIACTSVCYNIRLMQTQQTASTLLQIGDLEELLRQRETLPDAGVISNHNLTLPEGFIASYISPDPKITQSVEILKTFLGIMATSESIPQDVVDAALTAAVGSAEAARIRALPLLQRIKQLVPIWVAHEEGLIFAATLLISYCETQVVDIAGLRREVKTEIRNTPYTLPMSPNEQTQDTIAKVNTGLMTPEDAALLHNVYKSEAELASIAAEIRQIRDSSRTAAASGDNALKLAQAAAPARAA